MGEFTKTKRGLQQLFPSSGTVVHEVSELREDVQLVHPFPSQAADLETTARQSFTSGANVTPFANTGTVPDQFFDEWLSAHVGHTFAGVTRLTLSLFDPAGVTIVIGMWQWDASGANPGFVPLFGESSMGVLPGANSFVMLPPRPIVIPPGWQLQLLGQTQGVAYTVTIAGLAVRRPLADVPLFRG